MYGARLITVLILLPIMAAVTGCSNYGERIKIDDHVEIYFKPPVTKSEAIKVGAWVSTRRNESARDATIQVLKEGRVYQLRACLRDGVEIDAHLKAACRRWASEVSKVLDGATVEWHICGASLQDTKLIIFMDDFD